MIDAYIWGKNTRESPEAPVPVVDVDHREARLGGAANVALNLQSAGARATILTVIGGMGRSEEYFRLMDESGLVDRGILVDDTRICTVKTRIISNDKHMMRVDEEQTDSISSAKEEAVLGMLAKRIKEEQVDAIILQDYNKGVLTPGVIEGVISIALAHDIPVSVDPKKQNFLAFKDCSLFKPNLKELKEGMDIDIDPTDRNSLNRAIDRLVLRMPHKATLLTLSELGVYHHEGQESGVLPAFPRNIVDVSGAGDTVISIATLALAAGASIEQIALLSNLAGGLVCEQVGVQAIDREALSQEVMSIS